MAIKIAAANCQLESGIGDPSLARLFNQHEHFDIVLGFDVSKGGGEITFTDSVSKLDFLMFAFSTYERNGKWIRIDEPFTINIWCAEGVTSIDPSETSPKSYSEQLDEKANLIYTELMNQLDCNLCGENVSSGGFTILEATYYSDDASINFRPYWSCCVKDAYGKMRTVTSTEQLREFIRELV